MRKWIVMSWLAMLFTTISFLFWQNEWKYSLPTPVPVNYRSVNTGTTLNVPGWIKKQNNKPVLFHFFNPDCPCSRFNISHFKMLVKKYGDRVNFFVVIVSNKNYTSDDIRQKFDLSIPVLFNSSIASSCGVYSTPQAVIIDAEDRLFYRGNYNKSRYCTEKDSNYAQNAIDSLLQKNMHPMFAATAVRSYGCSLPSCTR